MNSIEYFWLLFGKLSPLFLLLFAGFVASRWVGVTRESLSRLLIYVISPIVFFEVVLRSPFDPRKFALPFIYAGICSVLALLTYRFSRQSFRTPMRNLLSYGCASSNTGYFGIPATIILLGQDQLATAIFVIIGYNLFEYSTGFFLAARGSFSTRDSLRKIIGLPTLWSFLLASALSAMGWNKLPDNLEPLIQGFRGAYSTLGIMMVGLGLGSIRTFNLHFKFISTCILLKLFAFPILIVSAIYLDRMTLGFFTPQVTQILLLMSLVPMAANGVAIATELKLPTNEMAFTITLSTILSLFWIPLSWASWVQLVIGN